jgi:hypothetical protein
MHTGVILHYVFTFWKTAYFSLLVHVVANPLFHWFTNICTLLCNHCSCCTVVCLEGYGFGHCYKQFRVELVKRGWAINFTLGPGGAILNWPRAGGPRENILVTSKTVRGLPIIYAGWTYIYTFVDMSEDIKITLLIILTRCTELWCSHDLNLIRSGHHWTLIYPVLVLVTLT